MAIIAPFKGIHFNLAAVGDLSLVVAPPYDVISPEQQRKLHERHPRNIVHIDFGLDREGDGPAENRYTRAAAWWRQWQAEGTLVRDPRPAIYPYEQEFALPGRGTVVRRGFLVALRLSAFGEGTVFPHEKTLAAPKEDRLALMRATEANTSAVFAVYADPDDTVGKTLRAAIPPHPDLVATDDLGVVHRVWRVEDPAALEAAARAMAPLQVFIADGHHRYETSLAWREEQRRVHGVHPDAAYEHALVFLCNMDDEGLVILPTHRGIAGVPGFTEEALLARLRDAVPVETRPGGPEDAVRALAVAGQAGKAIAWTAGAHRFHLVTFPDPEQFAARHLAAHPSELRTLDVVLLHGFVFGQVLGISPEAVTAGQFVRYYKDAALAAADLATGAIQAAFFLNPVTVGEFRRVALSGHLLPQKTTYFHPKIATGLIALSVAAGERVGLGGT